LLVQLIRLVERVFGLAHRLEIPSLFHQEPLRKRILIALSIDLIVQHVHAHVQQQNRRAAGTGVRRVPDRLHARDAHLVHDQAVHRARSKSQISHDGGRQHLGAATRQCAGERADVVAYAKNDHLGFQIYYLWRGSRRRFVPDFLAKLVNGKTLVLEIKGEDSDQNRAKRDGARCLGARLVSTPEAGSGRGAGMW
jgi:type III restriction enzyme